MKRCVRGLAVVVGLLGGGCSVDEAPPPPAYTLEVESVEEQARAAVLASDVDFTVELANGDDAWARAHLFISQYTGEKDPTPRALGERRVIITSEGASADPFIYRVVRFISPRGYRFHVSCEPRLPEGDREVAERNARNVARFIKEGTLELSLLVR